MDIVRASRVREKKVSIVIVEGEGGGNESASKGDCLEGEGKVQGERGLNEPRRTVSPYIRPYLSLQPIFQVH